MVSRLPSSPRWTLLVCCVALATVVSPPARAAAPSTPSAADRDKAQALFEAGLKRKQHGYEQVACDLFEQSVALAGTPHGWLQVGRCREARDPVGALASFEAALAAADQERDASRRQAYVAAARERIARLTALVPTITFREPHTERASVDVTAPGSDATTVVSRFDRPLRFNPGRYRVRARAAGHLPHHIDIDLKEGEHLDVDVPDLDELPAASEGRDPEPIPLAVAPVEARAPVEPVVVPRQENGAGNGAANGAESDGSHSNVLPYVLGGSGVALVLAGIVVGQASSSARDELLHDCSAPDTDGRRFCGSDEGSTKRRMESYALAADVLWVSGVVLAGTGVTMYLLTKGSARETRVSAGCFGTGCGVSAAGRF